MHVAVAGWLLETGASGANRRLLSLLRAVAPQLAAGERITLLTSAATAAPPQDLPGIAMQPVRIAPRPTWRRALDERRRLPGILRTLAADVLDLASLPVPPTLPCAVCLTVHDVRDLRRSAGAGRRSSILARLITRRALARSDHLVTPSAWTAQALRDGAGVALPPHTVVPGAVDAALRTRTRPATPRRHDPYLLHVGHLEPRKNLILLLDALAAARRQNPALPRLLLVGADAGAGLQLQRRIRALQIDAAVELAGAVPDDRLAELYSGATAVLVPSLHEGFGMPALEGLAAGTPVLVSDRGALPEVVGGAGTVLPAQDPHAWTRALLQLVADDAHHAADTAARRVRAAAFSWERSAAALLEVWRSLARDQELATSCIAR